MDFRGLDLNLLVVLDAVITEKNVTRASKRIHLSQSATSAALSRLRDFFKDDLLVPIGRKMELTNLALSLEKPVRNLLLQVESTVISREEFAPASSTRTFSVVASDYFVSVLLVEVLRDLHEQAPSVRFEIWPMMDAALELLDNGEVDLLFTPEQFASPQQPKEYLYEETYSCVAWSKNPRVGKTISAEDYIAGGHVEIRFGEVRHSITEERLRAVGCNRRLEIVVPHSAAIPQFVVGTDRLATLPTRLAALYASHFPLKYVPLPIKIAPTRLYMQWHRFQEHHADSIWFRKAVQEIVSQRTQ